MTTKRGVLMPAVVQQLIDLAKQSIKAGRTRMLVALTGVGGCGAGIYFMPEHAVIFVICIAVIVVVFMLTKTLTDIFAKRSRRNGEHGT